MSERLAQLHFDVLAPVLAALVTVLFPWLRDLGSSARRLRSLDEASKRLAFWSAYREAIASKQDAERALAEIQQAAESASLLYKERAPDAWEPAEYARYYSRLFLPRKVMLIFSMPTRKAINCRRAALFSLALSVGIIFVGRAGWIAVGNRTAQFIFWLWLLSLENYVEAQFRCFLASHRGK